jgi:hypothetical protein
MTKQLYEWQQQSATRVEQQPGALLRIYLPEVQPAIKLVVSPERGWHALPRRPRLQRNDDARSC